MKNYETIFIVNPNLSADDYGQVLKKFTTQVEKQKGVVVKVEELGTQRLAYEVKKFDRGTYVLLNYCGGPGVTAELERDLKLDDRILKYQTVKLADDVDAQELLQKETEAKTQAVTKQEEPAPQEAATTQEQGEPSGEVNHGV